MEPEQKGSAEQPPASYVSLEGLHGTVRVPSQKAGFWPQCGHSWDRPYSSASATWTGQLGHGLAGRRAIQIRAALGGRSRKFDGDFLQVISARLGVATGKDLAQCCRDWYPRWTGWPNWIAMEIAIGMTDLAESLGSAVALNLLFHIPMPVGDHHNGIRRFTPPGSPGIWKRLIEAVVAVFVLTIAGVTASRSSVLRRRDPIFWKWGAPWYTPTSRKQHACRGDGMIGATVMPHNLFLHTALVQTRQLQHDESSIRRAIRFNTIDTTVALAIAFFRQCSHFWC